MVVASSAHVQRLADVMRSFAWWCVLAMAAVLPLVSLNPTILGIGDNPLTVDQAELPRAVLIVTLAGVGLAAWALSESIDSRGVRWSREWWALGAFVALAGVSAFLSPYPHLAYVGKWFHWEGLITLTAYAMWSFLAAQVTDRSRVIAFVRVGAGIGAVVAAYGIVQALGADPATWLSSTFGLTRAFSTWSNPDFFGGYLMFPLAFGIVVAAGDKDKRWRLVGAVSSALVVFALVASLTRGAWLVGTALAIVMVFALQRKGLIEPRLLLGGIIAVIGALVIVGAVSGGAVTERAVSAFSPEDKGVATRIGIWQETVPLAFGHPIMGAGPDTFEVAFVKLQTDGAPYFIDDPHNALLYLLITLGVPATVCVVAVAGAVLVRAGRDVLSGHEAAERLALLGVWGAAAAYCVYLMGSMSVVGTTALLFMCLGIMVAPYATRVFVARAVLVGIAAFAIAFAGVGAYLGTRGVLADHAYLQARVAAHGGGDRVQPAARAVDLNPLNPRYRQELAEAEAERGADDD